MFGGKEARFSFMSILIENVSKTFAGFRALRHVHLEIPTGSLTALVGPSGSGKSTLLRLIAGFETPDEGQVWLDGRKRTTTPPAERELGVVFQNYALFPHLTVAENVGFGLQRRNLPLEEQKERLLERLKLVRLEGLAQRYPSQLSGGQRQRVALARALALEPRVLLLDEPFAALDPKVRGDLREWLRRLHEEVAVTTLLVTHDQQEAREVADQLVVFRGGRIEQVGSPLEVYDTPASAFVRGFVGHASPFPRHSTNSTILRETEETSSLALQTKVWNGGSRTSSLSPIHGLVRPHGFELQEQERAGTNFPKVAVQRRTYGETLVRLELDPFQKENSSLFRLQLSRRKAREMQSQKVFQLLPRLKNENQRRKLSPRFLARKRWGDLDKIFIISYNNKSREGCPSGLRCRSGTSVLSKANEGSNPSSSEVMFCGYCIMVVRQLSTLNAGVRFPLPAYLLLFFILYEVILPFLFFSFFFSKRK